MLTVFLKRLSATQIISLGFFLLILTGTILLMLPISSRTGECTPFLTALFTATSATCVTGLVLVDTYTHWSLFGQLILITLIQIGGLGFITFGTLVSLIFNKKITLQQRGWIKESFNVLEIGGVVRLIRMVLKGTLLFEGVGAIILFFCFLPDMGFTTSLYYGIFHSISAFCNAGFDLMGQFGNSSFSAYYDHPIVVLTLVSLILIGGIGFFCWNDLATHRFNFKKYALQTKMVFSASIVLVFGGALLFYFIERNALYADMTPLGKACASLFQAVTPRTAGFNTTDTAALSESGKLLTIILMFIGGCSGSTAGGVKVGTIFVLVLYLRSILRNSKGTNIFGRRIETDTVSKASAVLCIYLFISLAATLILCAIDGFAIGDALFEVVSAICTVGMTAGVTSKLSTVSQILIAFLMYVGRLGSLSFALSFTNQKKTPHLLLPVEQINIG